MSSMTKATARPVSTIWKASGWPFAEMMFMPRFCAPLISVICLMLVVPAVETRVLPFRSASERMFADFLVIQRLAVTKCVIVNHTCAWRARLLVVAPHSRSIVPFAICWMRYGDGQGQDGKNQRERSGHVGLLGRRSRRGWVGGGGCTILRESPVPCPSGTGRPRDGKTPRAD